LEPSSKLTIVGAGSTIFTLEIPLVFANSPLK